MENISFDSGMQQYRINGGGVLRFNPGDPNLYARFLESADKIREIEQQLTDRAEHMEQPDSGAAAVKLMAQADKEMKEVLRWVFGGENDFDQLLGGINLLAVAGNGERVITNLFAALEPVLVAGAEKCARDLEQAAVEQANARREAQ